jgi:hypothetical protein
MRRQCDKLDATVAEQRGGTDQKCVGLLLRQARKGRVNVAIGTDCDDFDL